MVSHLTTKQKSGIGVFGGTFDPVHLGHTHSAQAVADELNLTKILFIPTYIPPHKNCINSVPTANAKQRLAMVELVCNENKLFECDNTELQRQQYSYTVDTLEELTEKYPEQRLYFMIGMDSLLTFTSWHRFQDILKLCHLVVSSRPNYDLTQMNNDTRALLLKHQVDNLSELNGVCTGAIIFSKPLFIDISSSHIRQHLKANKSCQQQLSPNIVNFINKNQLYR